MTEIQRGKDITSEPGIGRVLAELVQRLTREEKREFVRWLSWEELETLRREGVVPRPTEDTDAPPARGVGEPRIYVGTTADGLALELPQECVVAFVKRLPSILSVSSIEVYLRRDGGGEEHQVSAGDWVRFLEAHQDVLLEGSLMMELGNATLVSGGGGCMLLTLEGIAGDVRRRLATEALRVCGFEYEFVGDTFTATVWDDELEVTER